MPEETEPEAVHYDTWVTRDGKTNGFVAVYTDFTGMYVKISHNGYVRCYEKIA